MSGLAGFKATNHPQQKAKRGADDETDDRQTPAALYAEMHARYAFTVDVAAAAHNTRCARYFDRQTDGLTQPWAGESVWCNPPYSDIGPWVQKAWREWSRCSAIVMLLPANRTEQTWWQEFIEPYRDRPGSPLRVEFIAGRLRFLRPGQSTFETNNRPPFGCVLLIWQPIAYDPARHDVGLFADANVSSLSDTSTSPPNDTNPRERVTPQ